jgi:peptidoglycan hydrolase-like protein with peptidoglycan-binding domain
LSTWHPLHLTSPILTDKKVQKLGGDAGQVTHLQHLLKGYGVDPGKADGQYGLHTARAVQTAKYRLGYRKILTTAAHGGQVAGVTLIGFLHDPKSRSVAMKARARIRAAARKRRLAATPKRVRALHLLGQHLGVSENPPGSNRNMFTTWYGMVGPWCAMCGSWARAKVGLAPFKAGAYYAYCPYVTADAVAGRNGLSVTNDPQPGDIVIYAWGGAGSNPLGDHFGTFIEWTDRAHGAFLAREGNTSLENDPSGSQSDGGILTDRHRTTSQVVHFVRVHE